MSNRNQHQLLSLGAFAVALLWVVSSLFGDGKDPGVLDRTTRSIVARLNSHADASTDDRGASYDLAVTQSYSTKSDGNGDEDGGWDSTDESAAEFSPSDATDVEYATPSDENGVRADQVVDVGPIHK